MRDDSTLTLKQIEEIEHKYLLKYWYFLKYAEDDIIKGFNSKNDIIDDWKGLYGSESGSGISDFAVGSERIIYALLNGKIAGQPNSSPVSSDLFFEVEDAFIHIDLKSVTTTDGAVDESTGEKLTDNIGDFNKNIFIGQNQNSYKGQMIVNKGRENEEIRDYIPNLPFYYTKQNGEKKITLTYFVTILYNSITQATELISIMCVPNGKLESHYKERPLKAGKNPDKTRFNFTECSSFELLDNNPKRVKVIYINPKMSDSLKAKLDFYIQNFIPEIKD